MELLVSPWLMVPPLGWFLEIRGGAIATPQIGEWTQLASLMKWNWFIALASFQTWLWIKMDQNSWNPLLFTAKHVGFMDVQPPNMLNSPFNIPFLVSLLDGKIYYWLHPMVIWPILKRIHLSFLGSTHPRVAWNRHKFWVLYQLPSSYD